MDINMFCKCYRPKSLIQLLPAMVCKHFSRFLSSTAHEHTHTLEHWLAQISCVTLESSALPFQGLLPMITEVTFSKVFFIMQRKVLRSEWSVLFLMAKQSRTSLEALSSNLCK